MTLARPILSQALLLLTLLWLLPGTVHAAPRLSEALEFDSPLARTLERRWSSPHRSHFGGHGRRGSSPGAQRVAAELGLGLLGGLVGGALGYFVLSPELPCNAPLRLCEDVVFSTTALMGLGIAGGVFAAGEFLEGHGDFVFGPFIGMALGYGVGALLALPFQHALGPGVGFLTIPPFLLLGAVAGYELSAKGPPASVQPVAGLLPGGGARVGLVGRF